MEKTSRPVLYVGENTESKKALGLLKDAGIDVEIRKATSKYYFVHSTPVLFGEICGYHNRFQGIASITAFIANTRMLLGPIEQQHNYLQDTL